MGNARQGGVRPATQSSITIDFYYRGKRCRERIKLPPTARNLRCCENLLGQIKVEIEKGTFNYATHFPGSKRAVQVATKPAALDTLEKVLARWLAQKEPELEHSSLIGYRRIVDNILVPRCGAIALRDFDRIALKELVATFDESTSAKRINNVLGPLRGALDEAVADDLIPTNPLDGFRVKRRAKANAREEVDPFTPEEVQAILAACRDDQVRNYCQFNFATGLRTSEMIGLCWSDIDWRKGTVKIRRAWVMGKMKAPKTGSGVREVQLLQPAINALKAQRAHTITAGEFVFHDPRTNARWGSDQSIRAGEWQRALRKAGVRYRYPYYQMRHSFASQALSTGENVMWVARQMGHRDWTITAKKYGRWIHRWSPMPAPRRRQSGTRSRPPPAPQPAAGRQRRLNRFAGSPGRA
ncbi:site-specific integrase [Stenotrophomonas maltophilia]|uniref:site-specific integrase n=1 Tax=Stenotrophomonas maltophilia TaxID=40324 RepID=UPI0021B10860|nr:site-specific integrase [Stenotrophomonas maltophilia]